MFLVEHFVKKEHALPININYDDFEKTLIP